jgi:hypothetical protein
MGDAGTADERAVEEMPAVPVGWNVARVLVALAWMRLSLWVGVAGLAGGIGLLTMQRWSKWVLGPSAVLTGLAMLPLGRVEVAAWCVYTAWILVRVFPPADRRARQPAVG